MDRLRGRLAAVEAGAEVVARDYGREGVRFEKSGLDFATQTDIDAEPAIMAVLSRLRPLDAVAGEESGRSGDAEADRRWLVDPLCGTLNFAATTPLAAVNVALHTRGQVQIAAVADPVSGELFWTKGDGSYLRCNSSDIPMTPTAASTLIDINCDGPLDQPFVGGQLIADPRLQAAFGPRVTSSTLALAWVATGRRAAYVSDGRFGENVHFAAGIALCQAAGCSISDLAGEPLHSGRGLLVSADPQTHQTLLGLIEPHLEAVLSAQ